MKLEISDLPHAVVPFKLSKLGSGHEWAEGNIRVIHDVVFVPGWNAVCAQLLRAYVYQHRAVARVRNGRVLWSARRRGKHAPRPLSA